MASVPSRKASGPLVSLVLAAGTVVTAGIASGPQRQTTFDVSGTVVAPGEDSIPPQSIVRLRNLAGSQTLEVVPDEVGRFRFELVPAGRYSITASSPGYVGLPHGASHARGMEVPVAVESTHVAGLKLELLKTATIAGTVRDRFGAPMVSVRVSIQRWTITNGIRVLSSAIERSSLRTDRNGRYQIEDLPPGEYVVSVSPGSPVSQQPAREVYLETFYPSTFDPSEASLVGAHGGYVGGIDIDLSLVGTSAVGGKLVVPSGVSFRRIIAWAQPRGRPVAPPISGIVNGDVFTFHSLIPGDYVLEARGVEASGTSTPAWTHWGRVNLNNSGSDLQGIQILLNPTTSFNGEFMLEGRPGADTPKSITVHLLQAGQLMLRDVPTGTASSRDRLTITGVAPGEYWLKADLPPDWVLTSLRDEDGQDFTYTPIFVSATKIGQVFRATYSAGAARLEGTLRTSAGQPAYERGVVVFPQNPSAWAVPWSNVRAVRPDTSGRFVVDDLTAGRYFVAVFDDRIEGEWRRSEFLRELVPSASTITMPRTGVIVQDVRVVR